MPIEAPVGQPFDGHLNHDRQRYLFAAAKKRHFIDKAYAFQTFRVCQRVVISISVEFLEQSARHPQIEAPFM